MDLEAVNLSASKMVNNLWIPKEFLSTIDEAKSKRSIMHKKSINFCYERASFRITLLDNIYECEVFCVIEGCSVFSVALKTQIVFPGWFCQLRINNICFLWSISIKTLFLKKVFQIYDMFWYLLLYILYDNMIHFYDLIFACGIILYMLLNKQNFVVYCDKWKFKIY